MADSDIKCSRCNRPISKERLEALPYTTICIICAIADDIPPRTASLEPDPDAPHPRGW